MVVGINKWRKVKDRVPWGTPYFIGEWEEKEIYIFTLLLRSDRYEVNHERAMSLSPSRYGTVELCDKAYLKYWICPALLVDSSF